MRSAVLLISAVFFCFLSLQAQSAPNKTNERLLRMTPQKRREAFSNMMVTTKAACEGGVAKTFYQGAEVDANGTATWNAACKDGHNWVVAVHNDLLGSLKIRECSAVEKSTGVVCFKTFEEQKAKKK